MTRPKPTAGLRHVALNVHNMDACEHFYVELLGMAVDWRPDADNVYLSSGHDNLALHRVRAAFDVGARQRLDHIGFVIEHAHDVDAWHEFLHAADVTMKTAPRDHRDGTRSFYCLDPDGNTVQFIFLPNLPSK